MFERFTDDARRVIVHAQEESRLLGHPHIGSEHLLLGLLYESPDGGNPDGQDTIRILTSCGLRLATTRRQVEDIAGHVPDDLPDRVPFTPHAKLALQLSLHAGMRLGQAHLARAHLLLGLLEVRDARAVQILLALGVDPGQLSVAAEQIAARSRADDESWHATRNHPMIHAVRASGSVLRESPAAYANRLKGERRQFASALLRYGRHDPGCDPDEGCSCGLSPLLDLASED